jgi:hypothetical protein
MSWPKNPERKDTAIIKEQEPVHRSPLHNQGQKIHLKKARKQKVSAPTQRSDPTFIPFRKPPNAWVGKKQRYATVQEYDAGFRSPIYTEGQRPQLRKTTVKLDLGTYAEVRANKTQKKIDTVLDTVALESKKRALVRKQTTTHQFENESKPQTKPVEIQRPGIEAIKKKRGGAFKPKNVGIAPTKARQEMQRKARSSVVKGMREVKQAEPISLPENEGTKVQLKVTKRPIPGETGSSSVRCKRSKGGTCRRY